MENSDELAERELISGILVKQFGLVSVKMENESIPDRTIGDEGQDETFTMTNEESDATFQSPAKESDEQGQRSSFSCQEEIESLKFTLNQLTKQMEKQEEKIKKQSQVIMKQKQVVTNIKSCLQNFAISFANFCNEEDESLDGLDEFLENEETAGSTTVDVDSQLLNNPADEVTASHKRRATESQNNFPDDKTCSLDTIVNCTGNYSESVETPTEPPHATSPSLKTCSSEVTSNVVGQLTSEEEEIVDMDDEAANSQDDDDKDSSYHPDDESEEEPDQEIVDKISITKSGKSKDDFRCGKCSRIFKFKKSLKDHIQSVHEGIRYKCDYCPGKFTTLHEARRHEDKTHKKNGEPAAHMCKICGIHLLSSRSINIHMSRLHKRTQSECPQKKVRRLLKRRPATVATTRTIIFQCELCPLSFPKREDLHSHQSQLHGMNIYSRSETETEKLTM